MMSNYAVRVHHLLSLLLLIPLFSLDLFFYFRFAFSSIRFLLSVFIVLFGAVTFTSISIAYNSITPESLLGVLSRIIFFHFFSFFFIFADDFCPSN